MKSGSKFNIDEFIKEITVGHEVLLIFKGVLTERKADRILDDMEVHFNPQENAIRQRILLATHEILKNIIQHNQFPLHFSLFVLSRKKGTLVIDAGNVVTLDRRNIIEKRIREVNRKLSHNSKEDLKNSFQNNSSEGIGFLEIRRKSGYPLDFSFTILDDDMFFFHLIVRFNLNENQ
ncbi:MAG: DUF6272 family protein [Bacteroidales bacterium]|nr:DUF6272 family protein [Bacteroidales bacterium]